MNEKKLVRVRDVMKSGIDIVDRMATVEFTGSAGVLDLMERFDLTKEQALAISDHFPIWAEFSIHEGGQPGRLGL